MPDLRSHPANTSFKPGLCVVYNLSFMFPCVLDVPVALHLGGWLLVICWPPRPEQIGIIPLLGSWRAAVAAVRHNFMRGLTARKIGMISQIISRRQQRSPRSVSLNIESRYGNPEVEHMSYLTYLNIYLRPGRAKFVQSKWS